MANATPIESALHVGWREWSEETFQEAREKDRLILLDLTAVWCHWCHVMDTTTYSAPEVVELIKKYYLPVRVDTDHRPDIASRYIAGGWPTTAFLTPNGMVLISETYVPPERMKQLLIRIESYYREKKEGIQRAATHQEEIITTFASAKETPQRPAKEPSIEIVKKVTKVLLNSFDEQYGGFATEPKFPSFEILRFLFLPCTEYKDDRLKKLLTLTLDNMQGIYDPVWGGFYRYSTNREWSDAHYEKMLGDNADAAILYLNAYQEFGKEGYLKVAEGTLKYVEHFLMDANGGFYASQDADVMRDNKLVDGREYYHLNNGERKRIGVPYVDVSIYADNNGKMISAFLCAYAVTGNEKYLEIAEKAMRRFIKDGFSSEAGFPHRIGRERQKISFLADQAYMIRALLDGYEATGSNYYLRHAEETVEIVRRNFASPDGGYFDVPEWNGSSGLLKKRMRQLPENTAMAKNLVRLFYYAGKDEYKNLAKETITAFAGEWENYGILSALYADAVYRFHRFPLEIAIVGEKSNPEMHTLLKEALLFFEPRKIILILDPKEDASRLARLPYIARPHPVMYACVETACSMPISDPHQVIPNLTRFAKKYMYINHK